jgi:DNA polymerase III delta prime subunit
VAKTAKTRERQTPTDDLDRLQQDIVQLARLGLAGRDQDLTVYLQRLSRRWRSSHPDLARELLDLMRQAPTRSSPLRDAVAGMVRPSPVDVDSRLDLIRHEFVSELPTRPIWRSQVAAALDQVVAERLEGGRLADAGLTPTKSVLFTGPPGVGKTLAARYLAFRLDLPLLVLDLAAVMSSLLGRTGTNVRQVMEYAKGQPCILLLDEFDAVAKRRDDLGEIGELKRLVTVLLQAVDDWPATGLLLAATNHPDLLDPAVWRRFEMLVEFPMPDREQVREAFALFLGDDEKLPKGLQAAAELLFDGSSYSDIERELMGVRRRAAVDQRDLGAEMTRLRARRAGSLSFPKRKFAAAEVVARGEMTERQAHDIFNVSRDVIRQSKRDIQKDGHAS